MSGARVYLMADFGKGPRSIPGRIEWNEKNGITREAMPVYCQRMAARAWWLVEAKSADAARAIITHDALKRTSIGKAFADVPPVVKSRDPDRVSEPVIGRILASGGAK